MQLCTFAGTQYILINYLISRCIKDACTFINWHVCPVWWHWSPNSPLHTVLVSMINLVALLLMTDSKLGKAESIYKQWSRTWFISSLEQKPKGELCKGYALKYFVKQKDYFSRINVNSLLLNHKPILTMYRNWYYCYCFLKFFTRGSVGYYSFTSIE